MPSVPIVQAAFIYCIENQDFDPQRWDELVATIRENFQFEDSQNRSVYWFDVDDASYELRICEQFIELLSESDETDGFFCIELMATVSTIEQAVADGWLDELIESERAAALDGEDASHD